MEVVVRALARREYDPQHHDVLVAEYRPVINGLLDRDDLLIRCRGKGKGARYKKCCEQISHDEFLPF
jgi:hypothetical protein